MSRKKTSTKILDGLLGISVLALLGFGAWYLYDSNTTNNQVSLEELIATNTPVPNQPGVNPVSSDTQGQDGGSRVDSGLGTYSLVVPDGWEVTPAPSSDELVISLPDESVDTDDSDANQSSSVSISILESGPDELSNELVGEFTAGDLLGEKYAQTTSLSEESGAESIEGEVYNEYYFEVGEMFLVVGYKSLPVESDPSSSDKLEEVEAMIRSIEL